MEEEMEELCAEGLGTHGDPNTTYLRVEVASMKL